MNHLQLIKRKILKKEAQAKALRAQHIKKWEITG